jgi:hypothetical protein
VIPGPTIVWLISHVAAFVAKGLFIGPGEVAVPRQEISCYVDVEGLLNMSAYKVVVAVSASRTVVFGRLRGQLGEALNGRDIIFLLLGTESRPLCC